MLYGIHNNLARRFCCLCLVLTSFKTKENKYITMERGVGSEKENDHHRKSQQTMRKWYGKNVAFMVINGALYCQTNIHRTLDSYLLEFTLHTEANHANQISLSIVLTKRWHILFFLA